MSDPGAKASVSAESALRVVYTVTRGGVLLEPGVHATLAGARQAVLKDAQAQADGVDVTYPARLEDLQPWFENGEAETSAEYACEYTTGGKLPLYYDVQARQLGS